MTQPKDDEVPFPSSSKELLEWLDEQIPHRCIAPNEDELTARHYAGKRALIDQLIQWQQETSNDRPVADRGQRRRQ
jgi:hypothetical protein